MKNFDVIKNALVEAAREAGIGEYEIYFESGSNLSADTLKDALNSLSSGTTGGICFRCVIDGRMGYASSEVMEPEEMRELVARAANNARYIGTEECEVIFAGSPEYGKKTRDYTPMPDAETLKSTALEIQKNNFAHGEYVADSTQSTCIAYESETVICNSHGLELSNRAGFAGAYSEIVVNKDGEQVYGIDFARQLDSESLRALSDRAYDDAMSKLGAGEVESGKYDIVISGEEMRSMLSAFWPVFSGRSVRLGMSLLGDKVGEKIAADCVTLSDDPFDPNCPVQTTFDAEGVATRRKNVIENGVLKTLLYNLSEAAKAGKESTGNAFKGGYADTVGIRPYRLGLEPGEYSLEELFAKVGNGIYVTEVKGLHAGADENTGDFSVESAGFMIENGKRGHAVKSFTIAGNFYEMLRDITELGNHVEYGLPAGLNVFASPDVVVRNISVAGK